MFVIVINMKKVEEGEVIEKEAEKDVEKEDSTVSSETIKELDEDREIQNLKKIEAALFLSARFLSVQELVLLTDINPLMVKELLEKLYEKYNQDDCAIEILVKEGKYKMDIGQEYVGMVNKLATGSSEFTKSEQETLAVIAYKQPVKQSVVIKIRGNKAYDHIKKFIESGLLIAKKIGHTKELRLSDDFFDYFHLQKKNGELVGIEAKDGVEIVEDEEDDVTGDNEDNNSNDNSNDVNAQLDEKLEEDKKDVIKEDESDNIDADGEQDAQDMEDDCKKNMDVGDVDIDKREDKKRGEQENENMGEV